MSPNCSCVVDPGQPCHACSAPGPLQCPYLYLLGWTADPPGTAADSGATDSADAGGPVSPAAGSDGRSPR
jgi:hypothetical protein